MNAHMEWEWRTNLSTVHKNICMLLFLKKTKSKKSVEWGGEIARVNCFKSFGDKNSCFPFPALIGEKKLLQLIPWNKDLSDVLPLVGKESVKNGGEKHNHVEGRWAHTFILLFYNQTELGIPIPKLLHGDIRCQFNHFYSAFLNCLNYPSTHFANYYVPFLFFGRGMTSIDQPHRTCIYSM